MCAGMIDSSSHSSNFFSPFLQRPVDGSDRPRLPLIGAALVTLQNRSFLTDLDAELQKLFPENRVVLVECPYLVDTNNHLVRVADLTLRTVTTFHLKGLEHLPVATAIETPVQSLVPVTGGPGKLWVKLDLHLPEGYHRNAEMPSQLIVGEGADAVSYMFGEEEDIVFPVEALSERDVPLDLTLYYCKGGNDALCLIHSRSLKLPVRIDEKASDQVSISYKLVV